MTLHSAIHTYGGDARDSTNMARDSKTCGNEDAAQKKHVTNHFTDYSFDRQQPMKKKTSVAI